MRPLITITATVVITFGAALAGFFLRQYFHAPPEIEVPATAAVDPQVTGLRRPDFTLPDLDGQARQIAEWDGKLIVINFWATWCPPCREEIPVFMAMQAEYADRGLQFIGIALQDAEEVRDYVAETGINYPVLAGYREVVRIARALGNHMGALPYTVIINRNGTVEYTHTGPLDEAAARSAVARFL